MWGGACTVRQAFAGSSLAGCAGVNVLSPLGGCCVINISSKYAVPFHYQSCTDAHAHELRWLPRLRQVYTLYVDTASALLATNLLVVPYGNSCPTCSTLGMG